MRRSPLKVENPEIPRTASTTRISEILDPLENDMLKGYFSFLQDHSIARTFIGTCVMRIMGFLPRASLSVLGGNPVILQDNKKFDLARELITLFGKRYAPLTSPRAERSIDECNRVKQDSRHRCTSRCRRSCGLRLNGEFIKLQQFTFRQSRCCRTYLIALTTKALKQMPPLLTGMESTRGDIGGR